MRSSEYLYRRTRAAQPLILLPARRLPASSSTPSAVVFFQITSLELSPSTSSPRIGNSSAEDALNDRLDAGELGCFVDPYATKLLQTGIERSLVPDVAGFLGFREPLYLACHDVHDG